jgi:CO/xanthine dehydrogenase Mo-binding subunit
MTRVQRYGGFLNADLAEYVVPVNADIGSIEVEFIDKPDLKFNSAGVKGLGEVSMVGVAPAIANAVYHATGRRLSDLPIRTLRFPIAWTKPYGHQKVTTCPRETGSSCSSQKFTWPNGA